MVEVNWRFAVLFVMALITIIMQAIAMKERKVFTMIQKLIEDNTRTNEKLTDTLNIHTEATKEQSRSLREFEKELSKDVAELRGAIGKT